MGLFRVARKAINVGARHAPPEGLCRAQYFWIFTAQQISAFRSGINGQDTGMALVQASLPHAPGPAGRTGALILQCVAPVAFKLDLKTLDECLQSHRAQILTASGAH